MRTKEKIAATALKLFNSSGISQITTRHIASEMGISHGNVCYHYPKREDIIHQLYQNLVTELDVAISGIQQSEINLETMYRACEVNFGILYKYKFILLHMVEIMRTIEPIRSHFKALFLRRKYEFAFMLRQLVENGWILPEKVPGQYDAFITQFYLVGDFWVSEAEILFEGTKEEKLKHYTRLAFSMIVPLLTEKGLQVYKVLVEEV